MGELIGDWAGKAVTVTLKVGGVVAAVRVKGRLVKLNDAGLLLELAKGRTFVPTASILHVSRLNTD